MEREYEFELLQINGFTLEDGTPSLIFMSCPNDKKIDLTKNNYELTYKATIKIIAKDENKDPELWEVLEKIYSVFNIDRPEDFKGHSLSMSDIIKINIDGEWQYHYCDTFGFTQVAVTKKVTCNVDWEDTLTLGKEYDVLEEREQEDKMNKGKTYSTFLVVNDLGDKSVEPTNIFNDKFASN